MALTSEPRHPMRLVVRRTGLTAAAIRAWERRYGAITPQRTSTNRRLYSDEDIERLRLLRLATTSGHSISTIAGLPVAQLTELVEENRRQSGSETGDSGSTSPPSRSTEHHVEACISAARDLDAPRLDDAIQQAALEMDAIRLMDSVLGPLFEQIGDLWSEGILRISHEHMTTAIIKAFLERLRRATPSSGSGPSILVTTATGQSHELGAMMVAIAAGIAGWRVIYMGSNMPAEEIVDTVLRTGARAIAISLVHPETDATVEDEMEYLAEHLPRSVSLFAGGLAVESYEAVLERANVIRPTSLADFREQLEAIASGHWRPRGRGA